MSSASDSPIYTVERMEAAPDLFRTNGMGRVPGNPTVQSIIEDPGQTQQDRPLPGSTDSKTPGSTSREQGSVMMPMMLMMPTSCYQIMMLMPGLANSLMFVEVDITKFLQLIENLFKYHQINSSTDKLEHLSSYCQSAITL